MLPPEEYERAAQAATYHLQLVIESVTEEAGEALLSGTVVTVFRGPDALRGTVMRLRVPVATDEDDWAPDGLGRFAAGSLRPGLVLEAYLDATPAGCEVALDLCGVFDHETAAPQLPTTTQRPSGA